MPVALQHLPLQLLLVGAGIAFALAIVVPGARLLNTSKYLLALAVLASGAIAWSLCGPRTIQAAHSQVALRSKIPEPARQDRGFVRSDACQSCHPDQYASWHASFHRTMTQPADPRAVHAPFNNLNVENRHRTYRLFRKSDEFWVNMVDPDWERNLLAQGVNPASAISPPRVDRRVVMSTGSHHQQTFWIASNDGQALWNLPLTYLLEDQRWVPREDVFLRPPDAGRGYDTWNDNCIECHAVAGESRSQRAHNRFETTVAELGITCEACHGPAHDHIRLHQRPERRYQRHFTKHPDSTIVRPDFLSAQQSTYVCGQCHGINVLKLDPAGASAHYVAGQNLTDTKIILRTSKVNLTDADRSDWPLLQRHLARQHDTFLGERFWPDGMVRVSGREQNAMVESACFTRGHLSCLSCHSMHSYVSTDDQLAPEMDTDRACLQCHDEYESNISAHTHHQPDSPGSRCYNCHMPHTTYGLLKAIRSHQIDSPSVQTELDTGRPNACNLCHLDQPLSFAAQYLQRWYEQPIPILSPDQQEVSNAILHALTGDANQRGLIAWHMSWSPAMQVSGNDWLAPYLAELLTDPYAAVRYIAHRSLRDQPHFADFSYDFLADRPQLDRDHARAVERWDGNRLRMLDRARPQLLIDADGRIDESRFGALAAQRNDRPVDLRE